MLERRQQRLGDNHISRLENLKKRLRIRHESTRNTIIHVFTSIKTITKIVQESRDGSAKK